MYDTLSGTNDYSVELVRALHRGGPLTVVTVANTRLTVDDCSRLRPVIPSFAAPEPKWQKALQMAYAYAVLAAFCLRAPKRTVLHIQFLRFEKIEARLFGLLRRFGVRLVYSAHNALPHDEEPWHVDFYRKWYASVDVVHVLSHSVKRDIEMNARGRIRRMLLIGHGPYESLRNRFHSIDVTHRRRTLGIAEGRVVILQYGLFKEYKGVDRLADAVCALPESVRPLLVLAGAGPANYLDAIQQRIADAGRSDCLLWIRRFVSDDELCGLICLADLVMFPYTKVSQSGALFLAMTFGKACLCSDLPGFREVLPADDVLFVDTTDTRQFAEKLLHLVSSPRVLEQSAFAVRSAAKVGFNWTDIAAATWRMYADAARMSRRTSPQL